jgi:NADH dehydrogenase
MILVTGACGAMGSVLVRGLTSAGHKVRACVMPGDPYISRIADTGAELREADITNPPQMQGICSNATIVYHLAAIIITKDEQIFKRINVEGTRIILAEAQKAGVEHFIYISSASVTYHHQTPYSLSKRNAEALVVASGIPYTIIRPTLVYGKIGGQEFDMYLDYLQKYPIVPFIGNGRALKQPVFVDDIMRGLLALPGNAATHGKIYNFSGGESISMRDFSRLCLTLLGKPNKLFVYLPVWLCRCIGWIMALVMKNPPLKWQVIAGIIQDANLDPSEAIRDTGYNPVKVKNYLHNCFPRITQ